MIRLLGTSVDKAVATGQAQGQGQDRWTNGALQSKECIRYEGVYISQGLWGAVGCVFSVTHYSMHEKSVTLFLFRVGES